jgi:thymidylate kinase
MKGIVIVEGCDGTGKTTLAKYLCDRFDGVYIHNTYRWPKKMPLYHTAALHRAIKLAEEKLVVIDRLWMSEAIYAAVYRNGSPWPQMGRIIDRVVLKHCGIYVMCDLPQDHGAKFAELKQQRSEMYDDVTDVGLRFKELIWGHRRVPTKENYVDQISVKGMCERDDCLIYNMDVEGKDMAKFAEMVEDVMLTRQVYQWAPALAAREHNFAGYAKSAKYMFVGDVTNPKMRAVNWPFYDFGHSSKFLAETLHELGFDETQGIYVNANGPNGGLNIREIMNEFDVRPIVFGNSAMDTMHYIRRAQSARACMHPAYAMRFNKQDEFKQQLRSFL